MELLRSITRRANKATTDGFDQSAFDRFREDVRDIKSDFGQRNKMIREVEEVWFMDWLKDRPKNEGDDLKLTISPDPPNEIQGAHRLMTAGEPNFSINYDQNTSHVNAASSKMEKMANGMWECAGRIAGRPIEKDATLSALMFAETHLGLISTADLVEGAKDDPVMKRRALDAQHKTPILFETWHPGEGYYVRDRLGITTYFREYRTSIRKLLTEYPQATSMFAGKQSRMKVTVVDGYNLTHHMLYVLEKAYADSPIIWEVHGLTDPPVVVQLIEGSYMWPDMHKQIRPWLYNLLRSGMWHRQNLSLTALYTVVFAIATNALFKHIKPAGQPGKKLEIDMSRVGAAMVELEQGEDLIAMFQKGAIDPALMQAMELAERKTTESTISRQALGEPLGANAPYSMVALLHQAGRLPLIAPQQMTGWALGSAMDMAFKWIKTEKLHGKTSYKGETVQVPPNEIPDYFHFNCKLDMTLPQDSLAMGSIATGLTAGQDPIVSRRFARERILNIGDSESMDEEIWTEKMSGVMAAQLMALMQQMAAQTAQQQGGNEGGGNEVGTPGGENPVVPMPGKTGQMQEPEVPLGAPEGIPSQEPEAEDPLAGLV